MIIVTACNKADQPSQ